MHQPLQTHCHPIASNCLPKCQGTEVGCTNASLGPIALHRTTRTITFGENAGATRPFAAPLSALMLRVRGKMVARDECEPHVCLHNYLNYRTGRRAKMINRFN